MLPGLSYSSNGGFHLATQDGSYSFNLKMIASSDDYQTVMIVEDRPASDKGKVTTRRRILDDYGIQTPAPGGSDLRDDFSLIVGTHVDLLEKLIDTPVYQGLGYKMSRVNLVAGEINRKASVLRVPTISKANALFAEIYGEDKVTRLRGSRGLIRAREFFQRIHDNTEITVSQCPDVIDENEDLNAQLFSLIYGIHDHLHMVGLTYIFSPSLTDRAKKIVKGPLDADRTTLSVSHDPVTGSKLDAFKQFGSGQFVLRQMLSEIDGRSYTASKSVCRLDKEDVSGDGVPFGYSGFFGVNRTNDPENSALYGVITDEDTAAMRSQAIDRMQALWAFTEARARASEAAASRADGVTRAA